jgi:integrase
MASLRRFPESSYWFANFTGPDGRRRSVSTKETDKRRARRIADQYEQAAKQGRAGLLVERQARKVIADIYQIANRETLRSETIGAYFTGWLERKKREVTPATFTRYSGIVTELLSWLGGRAALGVAHLSSGDVSRFRDHLAKKHSAVSVNIARATIRAALYDAFRDGLVDVNEAARVPKLEELSKTRPKRRAFTEEELRAILKSSDTEWRGMVLVGAYAGLRLGDVAILRWQNVDLSNRELRFTSQKTGRVMVIPIAPPLHGHLMTIAGTDEVDSPLFPGAFALRSKTKNGLSNKFYRLMTVAGVVPKRTNKKKKGGQGRGAGRTSGGLGFHCLRHYCTTALKTAGASDVVAREIIGHESAAVSRTYSHIGMDTLRPIVDKLPDITD